MNAVDTMLSRFVRSHQVKAAALTTGAAEEFAKSYVAGATVDDALAAARRLVAQGLLISLAYLPRPEEEATAARVLRDAVRALGPVAEGAELSVKPLTLGMRDDPAAARRRLDELCRVAAECRAHVTLEMQGHSHYADTLRLWRDVVADYPMLGLTLPAELRRSESEAHRLADLGARLRLCVGDFPVPRTLGYRSDHDKDLAWVRLLRCTMASGGYAMAATHHPTLIAIAQDLASRHEVPPSGFEFQMFYGVRPLEQRRLADIGYRSRTYIPFGPAWYEYFAERIAARPRTLIGYLGAIWDKR